MSRQLRTRTFRILNQKLLIQEPLDPDEILADAATGKGADPYWGKIWGSAPDAAAAIMASNWPAGTRTLELGCGCGLLGIAGLFAGLDVTFSDHEIEAVELAVDNARLNGWPDAKGLVLDWNRPPVSKYDLLIANDILYESPFHQPLLGAAESLLRENGVFQIGDPGRTLAKTFLQLAMKSGWKVEIYGRELNPVMTPTTNQFQWLVLRK